MRDWAGKPYHSLNFYLRERFGEKVYRVSLDAGFTCPNRDGTLGRGGCTFCNEAGARASYVDPEKSVWDQLQEGKTLVKRRYGARKFIAYFQAYTNTWGPLDVLERVYRSVLQDPDVVMISIGTRPDCVPTEVLKLIEDLAKERPIIMEYGIQTLNDGILRSIHRGHLAEDSKDAILRTTKLKNVEILAHCLFGLPGESRKSMLDTVQTLIQWGVDAFKFHHLYLEKNTQLGLEYQKNPFPLLSRDEYLDLLCEILPQLPQDKVIHRLFGQSDRKNLIAPLWTLNKHLNEQTLVDTLHKRKLWQGSLL